MLQLNPPVGDDHAKPAVTLQHRLNNLRLAFNPRDPNRTGLKAYSGMLSRILDEFKADLQTSEISHVKILLDSLKRQSSGNSKPELRGLYARVARKESECITFDTFEEILQAEARDLVASTIAVARMRLLAPRPASSSTPTSRPKPGSHTLQYRVTHATNVVGLDINPLIAFLSNIPISTRSPSHGPCLSKGRHGR